MLVIQADDYNQNAPTLIVAAVTSVIKKRYLPVSYTHLDVYKRQATAGIGTNMYLCKIAMDIVAKHIEPDKDGVRIAELDEMSYRRQLWNHRPLTDFWRVGKRCV